MLSLSLSDLASRARKAGASLPVLPSGFAFVTRKGAYVTARGLFIIKRIP